MGTSEVKAVMAVLKATTAPLAVLDENGLCVQATKSFAGLLGIADAAQLVGQALDVPREAEVRSFSPGNGRAWRLITLEMPEARDIGPSQASILDSLSAVVDVRGREHRYLYLNRFGARLFGVDPLAVIGRPLEQVLGPELARLLTRHDEALFAGRQASALFEDQFAGVDGVLRDWVIAKTVLHDKGGRMSGVVMLATDVTERRRTQHALATAQTPADGAQPARYIATVGHELRAPLASIIGCAEFLAEESMGPLGHESYRAFTSDITNNARHLQSIVNDILDMASLESGRLRLDEELVEVDRMLHHVHRMMEMSARNKHLAVSIQAEEGLPPLCADPRRIRQIIVNLLSNAIKFTPDYGQITLSAGRGEDGSFILSVRDTGIGIAKSDIAIALTPFGRLEHGRVRQEEGTGLGLSLTKAMTEAHGGRLELTSSLGSGTEVRVILPAERLHPRRPA